METDAEVGGKTKRKLLFCPFFQYSGSNNPSYLNHIICMHYNASYGCRKCLKEVFPTGQWLTLHIKCCKGLKTEAAEDKPATSHAKGTSSSSSRSKKKKHQTKSQQSDSQQDSQTLLPTSSQVSLHMSPCCSGHDKKKTVATTPKKSQSSSKDLGGKCSSNHKHPSKKHKVHKSDKQQKKYSGLPKDREVPTAHHLYYSV